MKKTGIEDRLATEHCANCMAIQKTQDGNPKDTGHRMAIQKTQDPYWVSYVLTGIGLDARDALTSKKSLRQMDARALGDQNRPEGNAAVLPNMVDGLLIASDTCNVGVIWRHTPI